MKIDPTTQFPTDPQSDRVSGSSNKSVPPKSSSAALGADAVTGEDTFSLSSAHGEVQALTTHLGGVPEVRAQLVSALQQRIGSGTYQPDSLKVADAIIADQAGRRQ